MSIQAYIFKAAFGEAIRFADVLIYLTLTDYNPLLQCLSYKPPAFFHAQWYQNFYLLTVIFGVVIKRKNNLHIFKLYNLTQYTKMYRESPAKQAKKL